MESSRERLSLPRRLIASIGFAATSLRPNTLERGSVADQDPSSQIEKDPIGRFAAARKFFQGALD